MKKAYQETLKTCGAKRGWHWLKPGCVAVLEHFVHQSLPKRNDYIHRHHVLWAFHPGAGPGINTNPALLGLILATLLTVSWVASLSLPSFKLKNVLFFLCTWASTRRCLMRVMDFCSVSFSGGGKACSSCSTDLGPVTMKFAIWSFKLFRDCTARGRHKNKNLKKSSLINSKDASLSFFSLFQLVSKNISYYCGGFNINWVQTCLNWS